jgi:hypothetical protein
MSIMDSPRLTIHVSAATHAERRGVRSRVMAELREKRSSAQTTFARDAGIAAVGALTPVAAAALLGHTVRPRRSFPYLPLAAAGAGLLAYHNRDELADMLGDKTRSVIGRPGETPEDAVVAAHLAADQLPVKEAAIPFGKIFSNLRSNMAWDLGHGLTRAMNHPASRAALIGSVAGARLLGKGAVGGARLAGRGLLGSARMAGRGVKSVPGLLSWLRMRMRPAMAGARRAASPTHRRAAAQARGMPADVAAAQARYDRVAAGRKFDPPFHDAFNQALWRAGSPVTKVSHEKTAGAREILQRAIAVPGELSRLVRSQLRAPAGGRLDLLGRVRPNRNLHDLLNPVRSVETRMDPPAAARAAVRKLRELLGANVKSASALRSLPMLGAVAGSLLARKAVPGALAGSVAGLGTARGITALSARIRAERVKNEMLRLLPAAGVAGGGYLLTS